MSEAGRMLVVGASSGIGRAIAVRALEGRWRVAAAARRTKLLEEVVSPAEPGSAYAIGCDVTDAASSAELAERAAALLDGLDVVVYCAGVAVLAPIATMPASEWHRTMSTNVVGAALVVAGALDHLREATGSYTNEAARPRVKRPTVALVSSIDARRPRPHLVAYGASKAALDLFARGLREEERWLRVLDVTMGDTYTGFADAWDPEELGVAFETWVEGGYHAHHVLEPAQSADRVLRAIEDDSGPDDLTVLGEPRGEGGP